MEVGTTSGGQAVVPRGALRRRSLARHACNGAKRRAGHACSARRCLGAPPPPPPAAPGWPSRRAPPGAFAAARRGRGARARGCRHATRRRPATRRPAARCVTCPPRPGTSRLHAGRLKRGRGPGPGAGAVARRGWVARAERAAGAHAARAARRAGRAGARGGSRWPRPRGEDARAARSAPPVVVGPGAGAREEVGKRRACCVVGFEAWQRFVRDVWFVAIVCMKTASRGGPPDRPFSLRHRPPSCHRREAPATRAGRCWWPCRGP
jgi:hypothetical protein